MPIKNLVFEGGSVKGIAYVGALKALVNEAGMNLKDIKRVAGSSAGAIFAALISVGATMHELGTFMNEIDFKQFLDEKGIFNTRKKLLKSTGKASKFMAIKTVKPILPVMGYRLNNAFGVYEGEYFRKLAEDFLAFKTKTKNLTFKELHELSLENSNYMDLYVTGVNLNTGMLEEFSWEKTPDLIVSDAVRISMSIPFIFKPHCLYRKNKKGERVVDEKGHLYADGGLLANYPIHIFDDEKYVTGELKSQGKRIVNEETLGFKLEKKKKKDFFEDISSAPVSEIKSLFSYTKSIFSAIYSKQDSDHVLLQDKKRTIYIDSLDVGSLDFDISHEKKQALINEGKKSVRKYFKLPEVSKNKEPKFKKHIFFTPPEKKQTERKKKISLFSNPFTKKK